MPFAETLEIIKNLSRFKFSVLSSFHKAKLPVKKFFLKTVSLKTFHENFCELTKKLKLFQLLSNENFY